MVKLHSQRTYLIYAYINTCLWTLVILSIGMYIGRSSEIEQMNKQFNSFISNRSVIYEYIIVNCPEVMVHYPIFNQFPIIQLCSNYDFSMKLGKITTILTTLFDTFLPYALYGPPIVPVVIMCISSIIIFYTNFTSDPLTIMILEASLAIAGYLMIFIQCIAPDLDERIVHCWLKVKRRFINETNESIYDNLSAEHNTHND